MDAIRRYALWGLAAAVIAAVVVLVILLRTDSKPEGPVSSGEAERLASTARPSPGTVRPGIAPAGETSDETPEEPAADTDRPREYVRPDGVVVRDHRRDGPEPDLTRAISRPRSRAKITAGTLFSLRRKIEPIVRKCSEGMDLSDVAQDDAVGLRSDLIVRVESGQLTVDSATIKPQNVTGDRADRLQRCIAGEVESLVLPADGDQEVLDHTLSLHFRLRR